MLLYIAVFLARALWSLTYSLNANYLQQWLNKLERKTDMMPYYGAVCVFYFVFEVCGKERDGSLLLLFLSVLCLGTFDPALCPPSGDACICSPVDVLPVDVLSEENPSQPGQGPHQSHTPQWRPQRRVAASSLLRKFDPGLYYIYLYSFGDPPYPCCSKRSLTQRKRVSKFRSAEAKRQTTDV
jgi:hypothetical protein